MGTDRSFLCFGLLAGVLLAGALRGPGQSADVQLFPLSTGQTVREGFVHPISGAALNGGPNEAPGFTLHVAWDAGLGFFSASSSAGTISNTATSATFFFGNTGAGQFHFWELNLEAMVLTFKNITAEVSLDSGTTDPNTNNNVQVTTVKVTAAEDENKSGGPRIDMGHPISGYSGGFWLTETPDLSLGGPRLPLFFQRHYDSKLFEDGAVHSALGPNWQHNYDLSLSTSGTNATIAFREGRLIRFNHDGTNWLLTFRTDVPFQLVETNAEFLLADPRSQFMYFFSTNGQLARIEDGRGNTNFLTYGSNLQSVTDGLNRTLMFLYDTNGLLASVSDGQRTNHYGHTGSNLTSFVNAMGQTYTYNYESAATNNPALMTSHSSPEGNTLIGSVYDSEGRVIRQTNGVGALTGMAYSLSPAGRVNTFTNALGDTQVQTYNPNGQLSRLTDEAGESIILFYDAAGRRRQVTDRRGEVTRITYDNSSGLPTKLDLQSNPNLDEFFFYTARSVNGIEFFDLSRHVLPDSTTNQFGHDPRGNLTSFTNRVGDVWTYGRNERGQLLSVTNPVGGEHNFTYDTDARLASASDSDVGMTVFEHDSLNRVTNVIHPNTDHIQVTYNPLNRPTSLTDERGNTASFGYDANNRLTNVVDALGNSTRLEYDALDRVVREVDRLGHSTTFAYDPRTVPVSLISAITNRNGFVTRLRYDERLRLTSIINAAGKTNHFEYDAEGFLTAGVNPAGERVRYVRDPMGYLTTLIDPLSNAVVLSRDNMKRVTGITDPLGRQTTIAYDGRGLVTNVTREGGITANYRYNPLGLLTNLTDPESGQWTFAYTTVGRLTTFADPMGRSTQYAYDGRGRPATLSFPDGAAVTNTYDGANNLVRQQYSDGTDLRFAYDPLNRLTNAMGSPVFEFSYDAEDRLTNTLQSGLSFSATYDADGRLTSVGYSNGLCIVSYAYDSLDRLIHVGDTLTGHGMGFSYDDAGRLVGITRSNGVSSIFSYDPGGRPTRIQAGSAVDLFYSYNASGQVTGVDYAVVPMKPLSVLTTELADYTYDSASQLTSTGYQYDPRGRQTTAPNTAFVWDDASRLVGIDEVSLGYNAFGDLVTRAEGGITNYYAYNYALASRPIVAERDGQTGPFTRFVVWSPEGTLLYLIDLSGNSVRYPHFDRVGSTLALTDGAGVVTDAYAYDPYGRVLAHSGTNSHRFLFAGKFGVRHEPAGNLHCMRARYYDPQTARFLSPEPIWPALGNPKELNPYQYALRDPLRFVDPLGTTGRDVEDLSVGEVLDEIDGLDRLQYQARNGDRPLSSTDKKELRQRSRERRDAHWEAYYDSDERHRKYLKDLRDYLKKLRDHVRKRYQRAYKRYVDEFWDNRDKLRKENEGNFGFDFFLSGLRVDPPRPVEPLGPGTEEDDPDPTGGKQAGSLMGEPGTDSPSSTPRGGPGECDSDALVQKGRGAQSSDSAASPSQREGEVDLSDPEIFTDGFESGDTSAWPGDKLGDSKEGEPKR